MRKKLSLAVAMATVAGTAGFLFTMGSASARPCPPGTQYGTIYVAGVPVSGCFPAKQPPCDPGPCDPTAAPRD